MSPRTACAVAALLAAALGVAGCRRPEVERTPEALEHQLLKRVDPDHALPRPPLLSEVAENETGRALVVAVDATAATVTLRHVRASADDWPRMNLTFRARRTLLLRLQPGDEVEFTLRATDGGGEILELRKRK
jgi:Cu/Ag efflux protein CusF